MIEREIEVEIRRESERRESERTKIYCMGKGREKNSKISRKQNYKKITQTA